MRGQNHITCPIGDAIVWVSVLTVADDLWEPMEMRATINLLSTAQPY